MSFNRTILRLFIIGCVIAPRLASAQAFYEAHPSRAMYAPSQDDDLHLFTLNPAVTGTPNRKAAGYVLRHQSETTYTANNDAQTVTKTTLMEEAYGVMTMFDLGAGTAAAVSAERVFTKADIDITGVALIPYELMATQTLSGRILIDLAPGLRVGLVLRWMSQRGDILGNGNSDVVDDRIHYSGTLIGHGGGVTYTSDKIRLGAAYLPAARGKSEVLFEQRITSEPGVATLDLAYKSDKNMFGLGIERAVHRRDERSEAIPSEDGNRTVTLDGISPNKNAFPVHAYHLSGDVQLNPQWATRVGLTKREKEMVFDETKIPSETSGGDRISFYELTLALKLLVPVELIGGYKTSSFSTELTDKSGRGRSGSKYNGSEKYYFISAGAKF